MIPKPGARTRSTLAATAVVAVALAAAGLVVLWILDGSLTSAVHTSAAQRASDVAAIVAREGVAADIVPPSRVGERSLVQVIRADGVVQAASVDIQGEVALTAVRPAPGVVTTTTSRLPVGDQEPFVVVAQGVHTSTGDVVVIAAESLASVGQDVHTVAVLMLAAFPLVLLVVAGSVYYVVGRALGPVEAIRARVGSISASDLGSRVPVPESDDEISRLASTMNQMLDRLQESQSAQNRFVADASHELRSPLAALRATIEVAADHPDTTSWPEAVDASLAETDRLDRLVDDLLLLAKTDERGLRGDRHDVDLDDIVTAERDRLRAGGRVQVHANITAVRVRGDRRQLERLLRNLCDNAARAAASTVELALTREGEQAVIAVGDDGAGIPSADRLRVFDRFVRLDAGRGRDSGGSGLGLAIVWEVAAAHGGSVSIQDRQPGTVVVVRLPCAHPGEHSAHPGQPTGTAAPSPPQPARLGEKSSRSHRRRA